MADIKRLIGTDGSLVKVVLGTLTTSATPIPAGSWVQIAGKATEIQMTSTITAAKAANALTFSSALTVGATSATSLSAGASVKFVVNGDTYTVTMAASTASTTASLIATPAQNLVPVAIPAGTVAFTSSKFGALNVGDFFFNPGAGTLALTSGDSYYPVTLVPIMDVAGFSLDLTSDETEVTVLSDTFKKYRQGRSDASGQLEMVFMKGETDKPTSSTQLGAANAFFDVMDIANTGVATKTVRNTTPVWILGYLDKDASTNTTLTASTDTATGLLVTLFQIQMLSFSLDFKKSDVVMVSPKFRLTGSLNPSMYRIIA